MYHSKTSFAPPLPPECFYTAEHWAQERRAVFADAWHLVGDDRQLRRHGDYVSVELLGVPVIVRNFQGELVALRNICAHRQCQLVTAATGHSEALACPYHGWEYGADGRTRKLPGASNFPKFDHDRHCLDRFAVDRCGDAIFVRLSGEGPTLREWFGQRFDKFADWLGRPNFARTAHWRFEYPSNWKIPVETALESYHIPWVHPKTFNQDPGETKSTHVFHDTGTSFHTQFLEPRAIDRLLKQTEQVMLKILKVPFTGQYEHHHVYPNLLISHTDSLTVAQVVNPLGPETSQGLVWQFGRQSRRNWFLPKWYAAGWGAFTAQLTRWILGEDMFIYGRVQQGARSASRAGVLGRCEERLHASQQHIRRRIEELYGPGLTGDAGVRLAPSGEAPVSVGMEGHGSAHD